MDKTEWRLDPLTKEWTIFNESRAIPPVYDRAQDGPFAESPFRAGLEHYAPHGLHHEGGTNGWQVRVVPNRAPILRVEGDDTLTAEGPYQRLDGVGAHEIVVEDPGDRRFEDLAAADLVKVFSAWRARIEDLLRDMRLRSFTVVKDIGRAAGQRVAHSLSQILATAVVPSKLRRMLLSAQEYFSVNERSLFTDVMAEEKRRAARVVYENEGFLVFCPYASRSPFELAIWPKRQSPDFHHANHDELSLFAQAVHAAINRLNRALGNPPWHFMLTTAPSRSLHPGEWPTIDKDFRWHASIVPRLHPTNGFEMATGCHVNGVWPEVAADFLRAQEIAS